MHLINYVAMQIYNLLLVWTKEVYNIRYMSEKKPEVDNNFIFLKELNVCL